MTSRGRSLVDGRAGMGGFIGLYGDAFTRLHASAALRRSLIAWTGIGFGFTAVLSVGVALIHSATWESALLAMAGTVVWWGLVSLIVAGGAEMLRTPPENRFIDHYGVPNGLTAIRAYSCFPLMLFATLSLPGRTGLALWCTIGFASGMLDAVDGLIARRSGPITELGRAMDPASDALFFATAAVGNVFLGIIPAWLMVLTLVRYLGPMVATPIVFLAGRRPELVRTTWGKRNTVLTGLVIFVCMWVRIFNGPVDGFALALGIPLLVTTTLLHFRTLAVLVYHAPVVRTRQPVNSRR